MLRLWLGLFLFHWALASPSKLGVPLNLPNYDPAFAYSKSFLDPQKFHISQSVQFGYSSSTFGQQSGGLYLSHLMYDLSPKLKIQVDMGMNQLFYSSNPQWMTSNSKPQLVLPHIGLVYHASRYTSLSVHYFQGDYYSPYNSTWTQFSRWRNDE